MDIVDRILNQPRIEIEDTKQLSTVVGSVLDQIHGGDSSFEEPLANYLTNKLIKCEGCLAPNFSVNISRNQNHLLNTASFISLLGGSNYNRIYDEYFKSYYLKKNDKEKKTECKNRDKCISKINYYIKSGENKTEAKDCVDECFTNKESNEISVDNRIIIGTPNSIQNKRFNDLF